MREDAISRTPAPLPSLGSGRIPLHEAAGQIRSSRRTLGFEQARSVRSDRATPSVRSWRDRGAESTGHGFSDERTAFRLISAAPTEFGFSSTEPTLFRGRFTAAYELPPSATKSASVAVTFAYVRRSLIRLIASPYVDRHQSGASLSQPTHRHVYALRRTGGVREAALARHSRAESVAHGAARCGEPVAVLHRPDDGFARGVAKVSHLPRENACNCTSFPTLGSGRPSTRPRNVISSPSTTGRRLLRSVVFPRTAMSTCEVRARTIAVPG